MDYVVFQNGRVYRGNRPGHAVRSYRHPETGIIVDFRTIPLYNEDGTPRVAPQTPGGDPVPVTWGETVDFIRRNTIRLHPVIHKDVIKAIRDMPQTVTSHKKKSPKTGPIIEHEPEVRIEREFQDSLVLGTALTKATLLAKTSDKMGVYMVASVLGIFDKNFKTVATRLNTYAQTSPEKLIEIFETDDPTDIALKNELEPRAIVNLARELKIIVLKDAIWYFDQESLGSNYNRIHSDYLDSLPPIAEAVEAAIGNL